MFLRGKGINRQKQTIGGGDYRKLTVKERGGIKILQSLRGYQIKLNCGTTRLLRPPARR